MDQTIMLVIFMVLMFAMFYFLIIRPQRKRQQEHQALLASLNVGDKIITIGGIHGVIESMKEDSVLIKLESGATVRMSRASIAFREGEPKTT
ncbi:MAG: preprotein translocase subunit YajC [Dehalococcoidales bacterium]|jgi:preprotein translocase subunit YajC|nr:preprotein translocase subunit YajC [Dehalococcoidales bacterium]MDD3264443.1 preprotein translocase subunit YajC [Dehalococcoidales bacterium]MDD4322871.1 preprotein translocase subunit YajC [Dehalococcoidales bacterium]MDD4793964.1 preprotein translocase subunit YajC [Dehalococcoidales bacterium]MDD5121962.1 preprotein translocase subunit YajC [Dehalococcoidales bacterium]